MNSRPAWTRSRIAAGAASLCAAVVALVAFPAAALELVSLWVKIRYPTDPSAGDSYGWGLVLLAPVLLAIDVGASIAVGVFTYGRLKRSGNANFG